ncbi:MAG: PTS fructose transporter subunit IIA [Pirellulaceae bacterium]|nr:MAG: PTS fructose transporter subunit IIA [Pirellulaceae bacterium]
MATEQLDIHALAAYLHLTPQQVQRMADRGRIPGRKVGGQWRFNEAEIHSWLEERIGASDDPEHLDKMQAVVDRWSHAQDSPPHVARLLHPDAVEVPLQARTKGAVIRRMCELAERTGLLWDAQRMAEAVAAREELMPTALEGGVALLHPRRPQPSILGGPFLALGVSPQPIPFGNIDGHLTDIFFLICSTDDRVHLRVLTRLSRLISATPLLSQLRAATEAKEIVRAVEENEQLLDQGQT